MTDEEKIKQFLAERGPRIVPAAPAMAAATQAQAG